MKNWSVTATSGGRYPGVDPIFFKDNARIGLATALAIKIFQLSTRQMTSKISVDCTDAVQLFLSESEDSIFVLKKSGMIETLGLQDSTSKRTEFDSSVRVKHSIKQVDEAKFVAIVANVKGLFEVGELDVNASSFESWCSHGTSTNADVGLYAISPSRIHVAFITPKTSKIEVFKIVGNHVSKPSEPSYPPHSARSIPSTLAVSDSGSVAVGNSSGVIDIFYNEGAMRTLKWHLEPVLALKFTLNDEYLISGGSERVLVYWQLATNKQQFLPRLDGAITSIAVNEDNTLYGLTLSDSQLVVLSSVDLVSRIHIAGTKAHFSRLPPDHQVARRRRRRRELDSWTQADYTTPLAIHPGTRNAYLSAGSSQAQAYNLMRDDQEAVISLAKTLDIGKVRKELDIADPEVHLVGFTTDGKTMLSVDSTQTPPGSSSSADFEVNLKFWKYDESLAQRWSSVTRVMNPHGPQVEIRDFVATENSIVTAGSDGSSRLWRCKDGTDGTWSLRHILQGFAAKTRHVSVALSSDHSVLALAHETVIYLVNFARFEVIKQLPNLSGQPIRSSNFVGKYLIVLAKSRLAAFDLVNMTQSWAVELKTCSNSGRLLAVDPEASKFALAVNHWTMHYRVHSEVLLFDPKQGPIPSENYTHPYAVGSIAVIPGTSGFCFIDQRGVLNTSAGPNVLTNDQAKSQELLRSSLVSLRKTNKATDEEAMDVDTDGALKSSDVNSVMHLFDSHADLEQLFDKVLTFVS